MKLSTSKRKSLPRSDFGLPAKKGKSKNKAGRGAFPMPDRSHALAAERLAPRSYNAGNISKSQEQTVIRKARRKLGQAPKPKRGARGLLDHE